MLTTLNALRTIGVHVSKNPLERYTISHTAEALVQQLDASMDLISVLEISLVISGSLQDKCISCPIGSENEACTPHYSYCPVCLYEYIQRYSEESLLKASSVLQG